MLKYFFIPAILISVLTSCNPTESLTSDGFFNTNWVLDQMGDTDMNSFMSGRPHLKFDPESNSVKGSDGCNRFNGTYELNKRSLSLRNLATTQKACPGKSDRAFQEMMSKMEKIYIEDGVLLFKDGKEVLARFIKG